MLRKLSIRLILVNLVILMIFFAILITGSYFFIPDFQTKLWMIASSFITVFLSLVGSLVLLHKTIAPTQKIWLQQRNFLADASHELRTPLAIIQTNLELVLCNPKETIQSQKRWLHAIHEETLSMTKLVDSLLFLSRSDCEQQFLVKNHFSLGQAIAAETELFQSIARSREVVLAIEIDTDISYYGDEAKLRQAAGILLDNALRHTPGGRTITITLTNTQQEIVLSVTDTGEGIHPEHVDRIFERFYQSSFSQNRGRTGLGLSIAKHIIEGHGGSITVKSTLGKGSVFTVLLPH